MEPAKIAPLPDFRYVGLAPGTGPLRLGISAGVLGASVTYGAAFLGGIGARAACLAALAAAALAAGIGRGAGPLASFWRVRGVPLAIVPWGVLVSPEDRARVLRWAAIRRVDVDMVHGRDGGTAMTMWSIVTVETERERLVGCAAGAVPLERLQAHLEAYAREAAQVTALDLAGERAGDGPLEPDVEPLLASARAYLHGSLAAAELDLPPGDYRRPVSRQPTARAVARLRCVLRAREPRPVDPRAFAAVVAAELGAVELRDELVALVQSPHPVLAAICKVAAQKLGVARARVGVLEEVAPFLWDRDYEALEAWRRG